MARGYRQGVYDFVIDNSFTPFTMQEMLVPFTAYKDEYEKEEAAYTDLSEKADKFKYLSQTLPEGSQARQIYEGYANDLKTQAEDLASSGLTMGNRRALTGLKRRYQGEIGRLVEADTALKQEQALRRQMSAKDPSMLYAMNNLTIDNYLDGATPNTYGISGTELYTKAAAASQSASKRQFSINGDNKTLGGYYYDYVQKMGYNPQTIAQFRNDMSAIPELQKAAEDILNANGVTDNLTGREYEQARQQVINGIIDGAVYQEQHNPQRDLGVLTAAEQAADARARESASRAQQQMELSALQSGYKREGNKWVEDPSAAPVYTVTNSGNPVYLDKKGKPYALGPDGKTKYYDNDKDGNYTNRNPFVKPVAGGGAAETKEQKAIGTAKETALKNLDKNALGKDEGFDITYMGKKDHYNYVKLFYNKGDGTYQAGSIGEDVEGPGWGFTSSSNVMDRMGNFGMSRIKGIKKGEKVHVLTDNEVLNLSADDPEAYKTIMQSFIELGGAPGDEYQIVEVPNESSSRKGYALALPNDTMQKIDERKRTKK